MEIKVVVIGLPRKQVVKKIVDDKKERKDETTVYQLYQLLNEKGFNISLREAHIAN